MFQKMKHWFILAAICSLSHARPEFSNTLLDRNDEAPLVDSPEELSEDVLNDTGAAPAADETKPYLDADLLNLLGEKPEGAENTAIEQLLINAIEDLRRGMLTGTNSYPVLDPYVTNSLTIDGSKYGFPQASLDFLDVTFRNLSTFVVQDANINMVSLFAQRYLITLDIVVPELEAEAGHYDLKLQASDLDITGEGPATLTLREVRIYGTILARMRVGLGGVTINVESTDLKLGLGGFEPNFQNLFNDPGASIFANTFLKQLVPDLVELYEPEISAYINRLLPNAINGFIAELRAGKNNRAEAS